MSEQNQFYDHNSVDQSEEGFNILNTIPKAHILVFQGATFIRQACFSKIRVLIGSSNEADLVLPSAKISGIHAYVYFREGQIIICDQTGNKGVLVNGRPEKIVKVHPLDHINVGPFTLKITTELNNNSLAIPERGAELKRDNQAKIEKESVEKKASPCKDNDAEDEFVEFFNEFTCDNNMLYNLVFEAQICEGWAVAEVKKNLVQLFKTDPHHIDGFFSQKRIVIKKGLDYQTGLKYKRTFEKTGAKIALKQQESGEHILRYDGKQSGDLKDKQTKTSTMNNSDMREPADNRIVAPQVRRRVDRDIQNIERRSSPKLAPDAENKSEDRGKACSNHISSSALKNGTVPEDIDEAKNVFVQRAVSRRQTGITKGNTIRLEEDIKEKSTSQIDPATNQENTSLWPFFGMTEDDDGENDKDLEDAISLRDRMTAPCYSTGGRRAMDSAADKVLEVLKFRGDTIVDAVFLENKGRYYITDDNGRFCLAEFKDQNKCFFYFDPLRKGGIRKENQLLTTTDTLTTSLKPHRKRKGIYREIVPPVGDVVIDDGYYEYLVRRVPKSFTPDIAEPIKAKSKHHRHLLPSIVFHFVFIAFLGLIPSFGPEIAQHDEARFVQLDEKQLAELEKLTKPAVKKPVKTASARPKPQPKPKPKPKPVEAKKILPKSTKKVPKKAKVASTKPPAKKKVVETTSKPSRHPDTGGGFGKGNVVNRDIKQTGILGLIADNVGFQPQAAIASVTNLDAVSVPDGTEMNLKVGGVVGKLGTGKIEVPTSGIVVTRGSDQVLRSSGAAGPGRIAALEKGEIGNKQVMGMVTADLVKSVQIKGGMSREAVKRVIDQHLDEITYCYETALIDNPAIMGKMIYEWKILMSGTVGEVRIKSSTVNSNQIHSCIQSAIKSWQFPSPKGTAVMVSYPFIFDIVGF